LSIRSLFRITLALSGVVLFLPGLCRSQTLVVIGTNPNLGSFTIGPIEYPLSASGGNGQYTWSLISGTLPPGISLRADTPPSFASNIGAGLIGVATTPGSYRFTLQVSSGGQTASATFTMRIADLIIQDDYSPPSAFLNQSYSYKFTALHVDGSLAPITWSSSGILPPGLSLSADGTLSGTPTQSGFYNFGIITTDGTDTVSRSYGISIYAVDITTPAVLPNAIAGQPYSVTLAATGGTGPYTFTWNYGSSGPFGLILSSSGTISGTPSCCGTYFLNITATDQHGVSYTKEFFLEGISDPPQLPEIEVYFVHSDCTLGSACDRAFSVTGGVAPYTWSAQGLQPGTSIRLGSGNDRDGVPPAYGLIWGFPTTLGAYNVQITVTDSVGNSATNFFPLSVSRLYGSVQGFFSFLGENYTFPNIEQQFSDKLYVVGGTPPYSIADTGSQYPAGVTLDKQNLILSGTPASGNSPPFYWAFSDTVGNALNYDGYLFIQYPETKSETINFSGFDLGTWYLNQNRSYTFSACCLPSYAWSVPTGSTLPPGLTLSNTGVLSGTPTQVGSYAFTVEVSDPNNSANFTIAEFSLTVAQTPPPPSIGIQVKTAPAFGNVGTPYSETLVANGGSGTLTWSLLPFNYLPPGLTLNQDGTITGTPEFSGQFHFQVKVTDSTGNSGAIYLDISIYPAGLGPPLSLSIGPNFETRIGTFYLELAASGEVAP
jgi:large repetitive protein